MSDQCVSLARRLPAVTSNFARPVAQHSSWSILGLCCCALVAWPCAAYGIEPDAIPQVANGRTTCLVQVDLEKIQLPALEPFKRLEPALDELRQVIGEQSVFVAMDLPYRSGSNIVRIMIKNPTGDAMRLTQWLKRYGESLGLGQLEQVGEWITIGANQAAVASETLPASIVALDRARWDSAWKAVGEYPLQLTIVPPSYLQRTYRELEPELPAVMGGGASRVLVDGLQWARFGLDPQSMKAQLIIQSVNESAADALAKHIPKMLRGAIKELGSEMELPNALLSAMVGMVQPSVAGSQIVWELDDAESTQQFLSLATLAIRVGARPVAMNQSSNNIKQLMLAIHNYESAFKTLPPHTQFRGKDGRSGLSWRVHILPFLDQAELYREFKLDEPWDSPHNRQLISRMPAIYKPVTAFGEQIDVEPFHTLYAAPAGEKTIFGGNEAVTFGKITDGTSNTIAIVELAPEHALPWTAPEDYRFDPHDPAAKLFARDGQVLSGFMDGSVQTLQLDDSPDVWNALFTMNGGEIVQPK